MKVIGLTGGIACGKSTLAAFLQEWGMAVIDADELSRAATMPGSAGLSKVRDAFGEAFLNKDGTLNRRLLGEFVFQNAKARQKLESIIHPIVTNQMKEAISANDMMGNQCVVLNVPLLYESGGDELCDEVWVVSVPRETQIERVMARDGLTKAEAEARVDSQMSTEEKEKRADFVIEASGTPLETMKQLRIIYDDLMKRILLEADKPKEQPVKQEMKSADTENLASEREEPEVPIIIEATVETVEEIIEDQEEEPAEEIAEEVEESERLEGIIYEPEQFDIVPTTEKIEEREKSDLFSSSAVTSEFNTLPRGRIIAQPRKVRDTYVSISDGPPSNVKKAQMADNRPVYDEKGRLVYDPIERGRSEVSRRTVTQTRPSRYRGDYSKQKVTVTRRFYIILTVFLLLVAVGVATLIYVPQYQRWKERQKYFISYNDEIIRYAGEFNLDPLLVCSIIYNESRFNPQATSKDDAMGLMQIIPMNADWIQTKLKTENFAHSMMYIPALNVRYGCWYLRYNLDQFGEIIENAIVAYHSGHGQAKRWLDDPEVSPDGMRITNIPEVNVNTINYLKNVTETYEIYKELYKVENDEFVEL